MYCQNKQPQKIVEEGKLLFRLEKGSWYGTDDMLSRFNTKKDSVGGYLSYETDDHHINTIFFSKFDTDAVLLRYQFDSLPQPQPIGIDTVNQRATDLEKSLISIRQDARDRVYVSNADKFFSFYENTALNFIPLITEKESKVFVLTGTQESGIVLIGNDYVLNYNKKGAFVKKEQIHKAILQFAYASENKENPTTSTLHSHVVSDYISSTDICTLLLYKDYVEWKQHIVVSKTHVSIFDLENESLITMTMKAWKKLTDSK